MFDDRCTPEILGTGFSKFDYGWTATSNIPIKSKSILPQERLE